MKGSRRDDDEGWQISLLSSALSRPTSQASCKRFSRRLGRVPLGDPSVDGVRWGPLAGRTQVGQVLANLDKLRADTELVYGGAERLNVVGADAEKGAFFPATLLYTDEPWAHDAPHDVEAFGGSRSCRTRGR